MLKGIIENSKNPQEVLLAQLALKVSDKEAARNAYQVVLSQIADGIPAGTPLGVTLAKTAKAAMNKEYVGILVELGEGKYKPRIGFDNTSQIGKIFMEAIAEYSKNPQEVSLANVALGITENSTFAHHGYLAAFDEIASGIKTPLNETLAKAGQSAMDYMQSLGVSARKRVYLGRPFMKAIQENSSNPKEVRLAEERIAEYDNLPFDHNCFTELNNFSETFRAIIKGEV